MEKLKLRKKMKQYENRGQNVVKVRTETFETLNELKEETGLSISRLLKMIVDYTYENIEWEE